MVNRLRDFIRDRHMTQTELAELLGLTQEHVNRIVNGKAPMSPSFYGRFALEFGPEAASEVFGSVTTEAQS